MTASRSGSESSLDWIPLRLVAVAPLAGHQPARPDGLLRVSAENLDSVMASVRPSLKFKVEDPDQPGRTVEVSLEFAGLGDFGPAAVAERVPAIRSLAAERSATPAQAEALTPRINRWLDRILHAPAFLELESAWRGLDYLARRGQAGLGGLTTFVLEILVTGTGEDWRDRFRSQVFDPDYEDRSEVPLAAVLVDHVFDHSAASLERLTWLAQHAAALQSPLVAAAGPAIFGLKNLAHLPALPDIATRASGGVWAGWNAFQRENYSRWVSLTVNRFLLRGIFGEGGAPAEAEYNEGIDPAHPEWLCWGHGIWALGASLARAYAENGHCVRADGLTGAGGQLHLPTRPWPQAPNRQVRFSTEVLVADEKAWDLCRAGFTPLVGHADGDMAYFPFLANTFRPNMSRVTIDQALTYQLYLGQVSHLVLRLAPHLPAADPATQVAWLQQSLFEHLSPEVGEKPGDRVSVKAAAAADGAAYAAITVSPTFLIQEKPVIVELQLPLRS